ncbi:hypothetical protein ABZZ20_20950 [Streptomyces sp. NPDC006430]|uniref:hypothetical protein n=1 Tax=Streptomyces sp. NPDC006430 TaxID=3154299 RepID=UPI0033A5D9FF
MRTRHAFPALTGLGFLFLFLAQALAAPTAAHAHGDTVKVVVTGQREGHVTTDITWENDGDAIEEAVAATVNATSPDGSRSMGPWRLVRDARTRTGWSTAEVLPPGSWKVTVDVGFPSLGHGEKEIAVPVVDPVPSAAASGAPAPTVPPVSPVASAPAPSQTPSQAASQVPSPAGSPSASPAGEGEDSTVWWTTAGVAVIALAGAAAGVLLRRARARRR